MTIEKNTDFGLPKETPEQRLVRLQAAAAQIISDETDDEIIARMVATARDARKEEAADTLPKDTEGFPAEYVKVEIFSGNDKHDLAYVPLGINGFVIKCPRGVPVIIPKAFVTQCLENAIEEITIQSQGGLITRPRHRFPYNVKGTATQEEYREFQLAQRSLATQQTMAAAQ